MIQTIFFGQPHHPKADDLLVSATGWRGGVSPATAPICISSPIDFALGGTIAGALAVAKGFFRIAGIDIRHHMDSAGVSLWICPQTGVKKDLTDHICNIFRKNSGFSASVILVRPIFRTLGLLPYAESQKAEFLLQDFDRVESLSLGTGLLCSAESVGRLKTRLCAEWMENRRLRTRIIERPFSDFRIVPNDDEPLVALCGFDSAAARRLLEKPGFDLIVEAGIGGDIANFDHIFLQHFSRTPPRSLKKFGGVATDAEAAPELIKAFQPDERCGIVARTLAGKAISTSFVGAIAAALVVGEVLRGLHGGKRSEFLRFQCRRDQCPKAVDFPEKYQRRFARSGYVLARRESSPNSDDLVPSIQVEPERFRESLAQTVQDPPDADGDDHNVARAGMGQS